MATYSPATKIQCSVHMVLSCISVNMKGASHMKSYKYRFKNMHGTCTGVKKKQVTHLKRIHVKYLLKTAYVVQLRMDPILTLNSGRYMTVCTEVLATHN